MHPPRLWRAAATVSGTVSHEHSLDNVIDMQCSARSSAHRRTAGGGTSRATWRRSSSCSTSTSSTCPTSTSRAAASCTCRASCPRHASCAAAGSASHSASACRTSPSGASPRGHRPCTSAASRAYRTAPGRRGPRRHCPSDRVNHPPNGCTAIPIKPWPLACTRVRRQPPLRVAGRCDWKHKPCEPRRPDRGQHQHCFHSAAVCARRCAPCERCDSLVRDSPS